MEGEIKQLNARFDELFKKFDSFDKRMETFDNKLDSVEKKIDFRLVNLEKKCTSLEKKTNKCDKQQQELVKELTETKAKVNILEQQQLQNNITIRGLNEVENNITELEDIVDTLFALVDPEFNSDSVISVRRIGQKTANTPRFVLVNMKNTSVKLSLFQNKKNKDLSNASIVHSGKTIGTANQKIFLSDHLTALNNKLHYHARRLKRKKEFQFVWTKLGQVYMKKNESSRAIHVTSMDQIPNSTADSEMDNDGDVDTDAGSTNTEKSSKRGSEHLSPRNTRANTKKNRN